MFIDKNIPSQGWGEEVPWDSGRLDCVGEVDALETGGLTYPLESVAQDLLALGRADAVSTRANTGMYAVDYSLIDVDFYPMP